MEGAGNRETGGMSRAAKRRRKEQMRKQAVPQPPSLAAPAQVTAPSVKKSRALVPVSRAEEAEVQYPESIDLSQLLDCEEETMSVLQRRDLVFAHLLHPLQMTDFYEEYFEIQPMHIKPDGDKSFDGLFTMNSFKHIIQQHLLSEDKDIMISTYEDFIEYDVNHEIRLYNADVSDPKTFDGTQIPKFLKDRQNLCLLNPQVFDDVVWKYLSLLELQFQSCVSMKVYHLHPISAIHAPHANNANIFIIQLQGSTTVKIYSPQHIDQDISLVLHENIVHGKKLSKLTPDVNVVLHPNQVMYVPKGWIIDFSNEGREVSLSLFLSTNEGNNMADVVDMILPQALSAQIDKLPILKRSIPLNFTNLFGVSKSDDSAEVNQDRVDQENVMRSIFESFVNESMEMLDAVADQVSD